jgi:hypothetical protein
MHTLKARLTSPIAMAIAALTVGTLGACGGGSSDYGSLSLPNTAPTASNFSCSSSVGNTAVTCNWRTLSAAADANGDTLTGLLYKNGAATDPVYTAYGTFTLSGDTITYTPDLGKTGTSDSATLRISDGKGGYKDVTVSTSGIDTIGPVLSQSSVTNTAGSYVLVMSANEAINTYTQVTKYENPTGSGSFSSTLPSGVFASLSTGFTSSSSGARSVTYTLTKSTGTPLTFRADFTVTDSLGNSATASTGNFTVN